MMIDCQYGHFAKEGKEFVITTPRTPRHWYNYLWNDKYVTFTSQVGFGEGFAQDDMGRRLYIVLNRNVYLLDAENNEHWTANALPVEKGYENFECVHGLGYTKISLAYKNIASSLRLFVPQNNEQCEIWTLTLKNTGDNKRTIKAMPYFKTAMDMFYRPQGYDMGRGYFDAELNAAIGKDYAAFGGEKRVQNYGFLMADNYVTGYDSRNDAFVGPYSDEMLPDAVKRGGCANSECYAEKLCFAIETTIELAPGEEKEVNFVVGITTDFDEVKAYKEKFLTPGGVEKAYQFAVEKLAKDVENVVIDTPDEGLNLLFNGFLKHQASLGSRWARVRHNGFRDTNCDCECMSIINPKLSWERAKRIISYQYSSGFAPRTFLDGSVLDRNYIDNTVWLNFNIYHHVKEIGDLSILDEIVPFNDGEEVTVYEHMKRSCDYLWNYRGELGLIKIWGGDWNDCLDRAGLKGKGMTVWLSIAWYLANKQFAELARLKGNDADADLAEIRGREMRDIVDRFAWDGEHYLVAYNDDGEKLGSMSCDEGKMHLIPQCWAVLAGICKDGKDVIAMDAVEKYMTTDLGVQMCWPAYTYRRDNIGATTEKLPGVHENGGVYLHAYTWKTAADCVMKRNDIVQMDIEKMLPANHKWVKKECEPYVMCNSYFPEEASYRYGKPGQTWRTGSAAWFMKTIAYFVLGLQPELEGLKLNPCLPTDWRECSVSKTFRSADYHITYKQVAEGGCNNFREISVNGKTHNSPLLPYEKGGKFEVVVLLD